MSNFTSTAARDIIIKLAWPESLTTWEVQSGVLREVGIASPDKTEQVAIANALQDLKYRGVLSQPKKGFWSMTPIGTEVAQGTTSLPPRVYTSAKPRKARKATQVSAPPEKDSETDPESAPQDSQEEPTPPEPTLTGPSSETEPVPNEVPEEVNVEETNVEAIAERLVEDESLEAVVSDPRRLTVIVPKDAPEWVRDDYMRRLIAEKTPCFGSYLPTSKACQGCGLAPWCQAAQAAAISALAATLVEEAAKGDKGEGSSELREASAESLSSATPRTGPTVRAIYIKFETTCARTSSPLSPNTTGYYVPGVGIVSEASLTPEERGVLGIPVRFF